MPSGILRTEELLGKANSLPASPGVYIMRDARGKVISVGKSRKLKNRVSQYFQNSRKNGKTDRMVRSAEDFDYILCSTEIEALSLENTLIKQYSPKYNIRLKDAKSYPYIKITQEEYPRIMYTRSRLSDKARYYGPFTGTATVYSILNIIHKTLGIPSCKKQFPRDIGRERPCMYYRIGQCCGVCTGEVGVQEYNDLIKCAADILRGNTSGAVSALESQMFAYADAERFEAAARCRDTINALKKLSEKQHIVASPDTQQDVFGFFTDETCTCVSVMYIREGVLTDKRDFMFGPDQIADGETLSSFLVEHYRMCDDVPRNIIVSFELDDADAEALTEYLSGKAGHKVTLKTPKRGDLRELCKTADENAAEKARQYKIESRKDDGALTALASMLALEVLPERIEAYDISNIGSENKTAGMIVVGGGKFLRADYRSFNIKSVEGTDDYACMREALERRFAHLLADTSGSFSEAPDLILLDGGRGHVSVAREVMRKMNIDIPVFGMVKDDYHKTRALCTEDEEINIARERSVFMLIYRIQEEVHRFTVSKTGNAKRRTLRRSSLESIQGIGPAKAKKLLAHFGTLAALRSADIGALTEVAGISAGDAERIYAHFHEERGQ
ncbi:MAG: excinuclease ABC subunit UvrC [Eubacteriales bacterium]